MMGLKGREDEGPVVWETGIRGRGKGRQRSQIAVSGTWRKGNTGM